MDSTKQQFFENKIQMKMQQSLRRLRLRIIASYENMLRSIDRHRSDVGRIAINAAHFFKNKNTLLTYVFFNGTIV